MLSCRRAGYRPWSGEVHAQMSGLAAHDAPLQHVPFGCFCWSRQVEAAAAGPADCSCCSWVPWSDSLVCNYNAHGLRAFNCVSGNGLGQSSSVTWICTGGNLRVSVPWGMQKLPLRVPRKEGLHPPRSSSNPTGAAVVAAFCYSTLRFQLLTACRKSPGPYSYPFHSSLVLKSGWT